MKVKVTSKLDFECTLPDALDEQVIAANAILALSELRTELKKTLLYPHSLRPFARVEGEGFRPFNIELRFEREAK